MSDTFMPFMAEMCAFDIFPEANILCFSFEKKNLYGLVGVDVSNIGSWIKWPLYNYLDFLHTFDAKMFG